LVKNPKKIVAILNERKTYQWVWIVIFDEFPTKKVVHHSVILPTDVVQTGKNTPVTD